MQPKQWTWIDKSGPNWPEAARSEPDKAQWVDAATGLPCLAVRVPGLGNLCGYVGVPPNHPDIGTPYDDIPVDVHGGLTFGGKCNGDPHGICHEVEPGEEDNVFWFGFDCAHAGDMTCFASEYPSGYSPLRDGTYRNLAYVKEECRKLAAQLAARVPPPPRPVPSEPPKPFAGYDRALEVN